MNSKLIDKLERKTATIGIVGLGYVGLPLMLRYCEVGYKVVGFDIDLTKVDALRAGKSYIEHISSASIENAVRSNFDPTNDFSRAADVDALILCVPTPLNKYREPDLSFVLNTVEALLPHLRAGTIVSLEEHDISGHHGGRAEAPHREARVEGRSRHLPGIFARTGRPRQYEFFHAFDPESMRWMHAGLS